MTVVFPNELLARPGAVPAEADDAGVAAHYGDPFREQRTLVESVGLVDRSHRGVLAVPGADRLTWLHSLTTQHLSALPPWAATETLVLSPHGHVEHHLVLTDDGATTWIDVEPGTSAELLAFLDSMRFLLRVEPADRTDEWALLSLVGPEKSSALSRLGVDAPAVGRAMPLPSAGWVRGVEDGADLLVRRAEVPAVTDRLAVPLAGIWAYEALRVAARRPRLRHETDHRTIVQEPGWLPSAVHLDKGCYRGQETVARVHNLGKPPRRLALVHLDGSSDQLPPTGTAVTVDERPVGFVTTAARHFELGPIALVMIKRTTPDEAELVVDGSRARIDPA
jgi:folate-binding protein YgfZ